MGTLVDDAINKLMNYKPFKEFETNFYICRFEKQFQEML